MASTLVSIASAAILAGVAVVNAESHTIRFDNQCGFGNATLVLDGTIQKLTNNSYTKNDVISGIAYLQDGRCNFNGENCTLMEMTLGNAHCPGCGSSTDISLIYPHALNVPAAFSYYNGCDGQGAACNTPDCSTAFFKYDDNQVQVACEVDDVNLLITFCGDGNAAPPPASSTSSSKPAAPPSSAPPTATPSPSTPASSTAVPASSEDTASCGTAPASTDGAPSAVTPSPSSSPAAGPSSSASAPASESTSESPSAPAASSVSSADPPTSSPAPAPMPAPSSAPSSPSQVEPPTTGTQTDIAAGPSPSSKKKCSHTDSGQTNQAIAEPSPSPSPSPSVSTVAGQRCRARPSATPAPDPAPVRRSAKFAKFAAHPPRRAAF